MTAQEHIAATARLARAIAGSDDTKFAIVFHALSNQVASLAAYGRDENYAQVRAQLHSARDDARRAAVSDEDAVDRDSLYFDRTYLENLVSMGESKAFIVGGESSAEFLECVAVGAANRWCCSGTLVAPNVVVTAAHCIGSCSARVFFGSDVRSATNGRIVKVRDAIKHPDYSKMNDIAVLILENAIDDVAPRAMVERPVTATTVRLAGYGNTDTSGRAGYGRRRQVDVPMASPNPKYGADPALEFVAGAPLLDRDSCTGDSGGPAYVRVGDEWLLAGVTSRATASSLRPCGDGGVYSRVDVHAKWIRSVPGGLW